MTGKKIFILLGIVVAFFGGSLCALTVGSNTEVTRAQHVFFPSNETNNMLGFTFFENGFSLENGNTSCSYDGLFSVSGDMVFNGGDFVLQQDLLCKAPFSLSAGNFFGNAHFLTVTGRSVPISLPTKHHDRVLSLEDIVSVGSQISSVDWSFDNKYVAVVSNFSFGAQELQIFFHNGTTLTLVASMNASLSINTVRWHPTDHYLAIGQLLPNELRILHFNDSTFALTEVDSENVAAVRAVAWHPTGNYLAVGEDFSTQVSVYPVSGGVLGSPTTFGLSSSRRVQLNALDWDSTGTYLAVGMERRNDDEELYVLDFNGVSLTLSATAETNADVRAVGWQPGTSVVAIGDASTDSLKLFDHDPGSGLLVERFDLSGDALGSGQIHGLAWDASGTYLGIAKQQEDESHEVQVFTFDTASSRLHLVSGYKTDSNTRDVRWTSDAAHLVVGDTAQDVSLLKFAHQDSGFSNIGIVFEEDVELSAPMVFQNVCVLDGRDHAVDLSGGGELIVASGASLRLKNMEIKGLSSNKIRCEDSTGVLVLENVIWQQNNETVFADGTLELEGDVHFVGEDTTFRYQSNKAVTVRSHGSLTLHDGVTFSYEPANDSKDLLLFDNNTSRLVLDNAIFHVGLGGINLKNGELCVHGASVIENEVTVIIDGLETIIIDEAITMGDTTAANDFAVDVDTNSILLVNNGTLRYKNAVISSWMMKDMSSILKIGANAHLHLFKTLDLDGGQAHFVGSISMTEEEDAELIGPVSVVQE